MLAQVREEEKEEAWPTWFPDEMKAMMNSSSDFPSRAHHLQRWCVRTLTAPPARTDTTLTAHLALARFGLRDFLILAPLSDKGCGESEASLLLSTLSVVINDTKWYIPFRLP